MEAESPLSIESSPLSLTSLTPSSYSGELDYDPSPEPAVSVSICDLPNEILMFIMSFLDTRAILNLRCVCQRLRAVVSDTSGAHWSAISWKGSNLLKDVNGLKLGLRLAKREVRQLSLTCHSFHFRMSNFVQQIITCSCLQSISLDGVVVTRAQIEKLYQLPILEYLHLDFSIVDNRSVMTKINLFIGISSRLKTLSLRMGLHDNMAYLYVSNWLAANCIPHDLRLVFSSSFFLKNFKDWQCSSFKDWQCADHVAHLSLYHQPHAEGFVPAQLYLQYRFSPNGAFRVGCSDMQLVLTSPIPGSNQITTAIYTKQKEFSDGIAFGDIGSKLVELGMDTNFNLLPSDLRDMIAATCPNLQRLSLRNCNLALSSLDGLEAIAANCQKLRILNLLKLAQGQVESRERLWAILATMSNLRVLYLSSELVIQQPDPIPVPQLRAIHVEGYGNAYSKLKFLANITSLELVRLESIHEILFSEIVALLCGLSNLTHLYMLNWRTKLSLPTDPMCYANLKQLFIHDGSFVVNNELACTLEKCKVLEVLILYVACFSSERDIPRIVDSVESLSILHIYLFTFEGKRLHRNSQSLSGKRSRLLVKSVTDRLKKNGRIIDFKIVPWGSQMDNFMLYM